MTGSCSAPLCDVMGIVYLSFDLMTQGSLCVKVNGTVVVAKSHKLVM